ncbi:hypothetical protein [Yoonia sp.]
MIGDESPCMLELPRKLATGQRALLSVRLEHLRIFDGAGLRIR